MTRIVTTPYRYKRPPRKRKPVALDMPAVVAAKSRRPVGGTEEAAAEVMTLTAYPRSGETGATQPSTPSAAARVAPPANDDQKSAIVTIKRKSRFGDVPDLAPEELQRRGEAADALWRGLVDQATAKDGKSAAVSAGSSSSATKPAIVTTARKRRSVATKPAIVTTARKRRSVENRPHLPMELPLSRKPVEHDGDDYKRMKAAMARRLRGANE